MIRDLTTTGFRADAVPQRGIGSRCDVALPDGAIVAARVVEIAGGRCRCEFLRPLSAAELDAVRAGGTLAETAGEGDDPERWPLPVRAAIACGGALVLWGLIALAM